MSHGARSLDPIWGTLSLPRAATLRHGDATATGQPPPQVTPGAIERGGATVATVKKALISPLRDRFSIEVDGGEDLEAKGNVVDHEYEIERGGDKAAEVSKRWFRVRDTYGIEIAPGQDEALILAVSVCIDQMARR